MKMMVRAMQQKIAESEQYDELIAESNAELIAEIKGAQPDRPGYWTKEPGFDQEEANRNRGHEKERIIASLLTEPNPTALAEGLGMDPMDSTDPRREMWRRQVERDRRSTVSPKGYVMSWPERKKMRRMAEEAGYPLAMKKEVDDLDRLPQWLTNFHPDTYKD
jgi:hypothetical protein